MDIFECALIGIQVALGALIFVGIARDEALLSAVSAAIMIPVVIFWGNYNPKTADSA